MLGPQHLATGEVEVERIQEFAQRLDPGCIRLVVDTVHAGPALLLQRLGRRHVGGDHEFLDQAVAVETLARHDLLDLAILVDEDAAFREVELQRAALLARLERGREMRRKAA